MVGLIDKAQRAKDVTQREYIIELAQIEVLEKQTNNQGKITEEEFKGILANYFTFDPESELPEDLSELTLTTKDGKYSDILASEIYNGRFEKKELISQDESYVGYFADIEGDGTVDGIIYADLAKGNTGSGKWYNSNGTYTIPKEKDVSTLKQYYIKEEAHEESGFDSKPVLAPIENQEGKKDRFYVMALKNIGDQEKGETYCWYSAASSAGGTSSGFGGGKKNTETMMEKWENAEYGKQNANASYKDMWGIEELKTKNVQGWFVPSKAEWSAFGGELGINTSNYQTKGLSDKYWSSSLISSNQAYGVNFAETKPLSNYNLSRDRYIRLSVTF